MIIDSFLAQLGFEVNTEKIAEFKAQAASLKKEVMTIGAIFTGAAIGIGLFVEKTAEAMGEVYEFAERNDIAAKSVAAFSKIASENGSSVDALKSSIQGLNRVTGEAALGIGRGKMIFEKLGLNAKDSSGKIKSFDTLIGEVSNKMAGLSKQEQIAMATKLGIDPSLVTLLGKGADNLARLREETEALSPFTEQDYRLAHDVEILFVKAKNSVGVLSKTIAASLFPVIKQVLTGYLEWFKGIRKATSGVIIQGLHLFVDVLGTAWDWIVRVVVGIKNLVGWMSKFPAVTYLAAGALAVLVSIQAYEFFVKLSSAVMRAAISMAEFDAAALVIPAIIGAILIAIGLLIDDYVNFKEGNDSIIGDMAKKFPVILDIIKAIEDGVGAFIAFWQEQWKTLQGPVMETAASLWKLIKVLVTNLWPIVKMVIQGWVLLFALLIPPIVQVIGWLVEKLVGAIKFVIEVFDGLVDAVTAIFEGIVDVITGAIDIITAIFTTTYEGWVLIFNLIGAAITAVFNTVGEIIDTIEQKIFGVIDTITGAIHKVGELLGLTSKTGSINVGVTGTGAPTSLAAAVAASPAMSPATSQSATVGAIGAPGGVLGAPAVTAGGAGNVTTNATTITGTTITVNSPDPAKAGEAVKNELDKMNKTTVRNSQSAVGI